MYQSYRPRSLHPEFLFSRVEWGLRICISHKFSSDVDDPDPGNHTLRITALLKITKDHLVAKLGRIFWIFNFLYYFSSHDSQFPSRCSNLSSVLSFKHPPIWPNQSLFSVHAPCLVLFPLPIASFFTHLCLFKYTVQVSKTSSKCDFLWKTFPE